METTNDTYEILNRSFEMVIQYYFRNVKKFPCKLNLALLMFDMLCLCKQSRSRSVGLVIKFVIKYVNLYQQPGSSNLTEN